MQSTQLDAEQMQIVAADADASGPSDGSPKRARVTTLATPSFDDNFWSKIQDTVTLAVTSSVRPSQEGLAELAARTGNAEDALARLDTRFAQQLAERQETDHRLSARIDALQAQVVDLQKSASPNGSPSHASAYNAVPPTSPTNKDYSPTFQVVVGGWQDGERREYLESQLSKLWASAGLQGALREVHLYGKLPRCAKVTLHLPEGDLSSKRTFMLDFIIKVKALKWVPRECSKEIWVLEDRTPAQRCINRAVAVMGAFVEQTLKYKDEKLEIDNWPGARGYLGPKRISGVFPGALPTPPPRKDDYVVWPVVDHKLQMSVWCDLQAISQVTGIDVAEVHRRWTLSQG